MIVTYIIWKKFSQLWNDNFLYKLQYFVFITGFPEIGIHAGIKTNIQATSTGWLTLSGWWVDDDDADDSFKSSYKNDLILDTETYVNIPITGIYHVSASVPIENINTTIGKKNIDWKHLS